MITWKKGSPWLHNRWQWLLCRRSFFLTATVAVFVLIIAATVGSGMIGRSYAFQVGQVAPFDIRAPRTMSYIDQAATTAARQEAADQVGNIYQHNDQVLPQVESELQGIFNEVRDIQRQNLPTDRGVTILQNYLIQSTGASDAEIGTLDPNSLPALLSLNGSELTGVYALCEGWLQAPLTYGLTEDALPNARDDLENQVASSNLSGDLKPVVTLMLAQILQPNLDLDLDTYAREVAAARDSVSPVQQWVQANQVIVAKGETIDSNQLAELQQLGLLRTRNIWPPLLGVVFLILLLAGLTASYLKQFHPKLYKQDRHIVLYCIILTFTLLVTKGVTMISPASQAEVAGMVGYMAPLAGGTMLITVLLDARLALFTSFILSLLLGVMLDGQISFVIAGLAGSLAGVYSVSSLSNRAGLIRGGVIVAAVNAMMIFVLGLLNTSGASIIVIGMALGVAGGFLSSIMMLGFLPYLEALFGITSSVRLLELSNPNEPLLKRLLMDAPGTYHHSIMVGNLAEAAAQGVHADPLLVRVGAYYHDIGKTKRPYFFIENQMTRDNPHEKLAPSLSTLIITMHVKDGMEQAREHKLPADIQAIIEQHHGTSLVGYFYQRALESERRELVSETDFRYDCPKPRTKEAALVMLADSVEAAIRSLQKPTPGRLESLTRKIIKERLHDGQLDECDLTFKDLNIITSTFIQVLTGIFHSRIEYPENMISEIERRMARGAVVNQ